MPSTLPRVRARILQAVAILTLATLGLAPVSAADVFAGRRVSATVERTVSPGSDWRTTAFTGLRAPGGETRIRRYRVPEATLLAHLVGDALVVELAECELEADLDPAAGLQFAAPHRPGCYLWVGAHQPEAPGQPTLILHQLVLVSGVCVAVRGTGRELALLAFDTETGLPEAGLKLSAARADGGGNATVDLAQGVTDSLGLASLALPAGAAGNELVVSGASDRGLALAFTEPAPASPAATRQVAFFTDRAGYRPGETLDCLVLAGHGDAPGEELLMRDDAGREVARAALRTEEGSRARVGRASLQIPVGFAEGRYQLEVAPPARVDGTQPGGSRATGAHIEVRRRRVPVCEVLGRWEWVDGPAGSPAAQLQVTAFAPGDVPVAGLELVATWRKPGVSTDVDRHDVVLDERGSASVILPLPAVFAPAEVHLQLGGPAWATITLAGGASTLARAPVAGAGELQLEVAGTATPGARLAVRVAAGDEILSAVWVTLEQHQVLAGALVAAPRPATRHELEVELELPVTLEPGDHAIHVIAITAGGTRPVRVLHRAEHLRVEERANALRLHPDRAGRFQLVVADPAVGDGDSEWIARWGLGTTSYSDPRSSPVPIPAPRLAPIGGCKLGGIASFARAARRRPAASGELSSRVMAATATGADPAGRRTGGAPASGGLVAGRGQTALLELLSDLDAPALAVAIRGQGGRLHRMQAEQAASVRAAADAERAQRELTWLAGLDLALPEVWVPVWGGRLEGGEAELPVRALRGVPTRILAMGHPLDQESAGLEPGARPAPLLLGAAVDPLAPHRIALDSAIAGQWWQTARLAEDPMLGALVVCRLLRAPGAAELTRSRKLMLDRSLTLARRSGLPQAIGLLLSAGDPMVERAAGQLLASGVGAHEALLAAALGSHEEGLLASGAWAAASPWLRQLVSRSLAGESQVGAELPPVRWRSGEAAEVTVGLGFAAGEPRADATSLQIELPPSPGDSPWWVVVQRAARAALPGAARRLELGVVRATGPEWRPLGGGERLPPGSVVRVVMDVSALSARAPFLIEQELPPGLTRLQPTSDGRALVAAPPGPAGTLVEALKTRSFELLLEVGRPGTLVLPPPRVVFLLEKGTAGVLAVPPLELEVVR